MTRGNFPVRQEEDVIASGRLVRIGLAGMVVGAIGILVAGALLAWRVGTVRPVGDPEGTRPAGRSISQVEQTPILDARDGEDRHEQQRRELERWGWADRDAGVAFIPIERAMDVVARPSP
jgi:hypothetical protein